MLFFRQIVLSFYYFKITYKKIMLDRTDVQILSLLQKNAKLTIKELAEQLKISTRAIGHSFHVKDKSNASISKLNRLKLLHQTKLMTNLKFKISLIGRSSLRR